MEHSEKFYSLKANFDNINYYEIDESTDIHRFAMMFIYDIRDVIAFYDGCNELILNKDELPVVYSWLTKLTKNKHLSFNAKERMIKTGNDFKSLISRIKNNKENVL